MSNSKQIRGQHLAVIVEILEVKDSNIDRCIEYLRQMKGIVRPIDLRLIVPDNREYLFFDMLREVGVIVDETVDSGQIQAHMIDQFEADLYAIVGSHSIFQDNPKPLSTFELAWTLPEYLESPEVFEPASRSLAALIKYAISRATKELFLVSPFLDRNGAELLAGALRGANKRNVQVYLISHGLDQNTTKTNEILNIYQESAPNINVFTSPKTYSGEYLLLHAKLVVADGEYAVLSSANLTSYGLKTHLEIGVGIEGGNAQKLRKLLIDLIRSDLVYKML